MFEASLDFVSWGVQTVGAFAIDGALGNEHHTVAGEAVGVIDEKGETAGKWQSRNGDTVISLLELRNLCQAHTAAGSTAPAT